MHERRYKIKVKDPNRIVTIKGREVRTPVEAIVSESELSIIKSSLIASGSKNFVVEKIDEGFLYDFPEVLNKETLVLPEKNSIPTYDEVKSKLLSQKKVENFKVTRTKTNNSPGPIEEKLETKPRITSFYIPLELQPNKNSFPSTGQITKEDFEVKIEDLRIESSSVLKKLLRENEK